ncbi:MAG TPA: tetratricopeptide repeat protein [Thermoanaerobaculia bacterium]|nr:tetratricopeptide repeat protein [Thermoanaerobaculia bacterium]
MRRAFTSSLFAVLFLLLAIGCGSGGDLAKPETQREFGVRMARMNLWREAMFRFRREVQITPDNAMAHNNLAVALEATGDFDGAAREYREALRLDRQNQYIQKNYSRFVEFTQKAKKRDAAAVKTTASATGAASPAPPAVTATAEPPTPVTSTTTTNPPGGSL